MVENWTEDGELERFVIFPTDDKVLGELVFEVLYIGSGDFVFGLEGLEVGWPVLVYEKFDVV